MTRVSVGLPVYNAAAYLDQALESLLAQTHADLEIIVSDNGSTDATPSICRRFAAADDRVRYVRHDANRGAAFNHNFVFHEASAPYFRWFAYDDVLEPRCIEACAALLDAAPEVVLAWPQTTVIDETGAVRCDYRTDLPFDNATPATRLRSLLGHRTSETLLHMCYPVYGLMRRDVLGSTHLMAATPSADTILLVELALRGPWAQVPERLFLHRRHAASSMVGTTPEQVAAYYDPRAGAVFPMPQTRLAQGYARAVLSTPLPAQDRARCLGVVAQWLRRDKQGRIILGEWKIRMKQAIAS
ncbi:glycosyltransferase family 2 protein [Intrasporangium mesophilum]